MTARNDHDHQQRPLSSAEYERLEAWAETLEKRNSVEMGPLSQTWFLFMAIGAFLSVVAGVAAVAINVRYQCSPTSFNMWWQELPIAGTTIIVFASWVGAWLMAHIYGRNVKPLSLGHLLMLWFATLSAALVCTLVLPSQAQLAAVTICSDHGESFFTVVGGPFAIGVIAASVTWHVIAAFVYQMKITRSTATKH